jgi:hypothetical protein
MLAAAFLSIAAATEDPAPDKYIPLTRNELSRLPTTIIRPARHTGPLHWSAWRWRHQHRAQTSHYQRQAATEQ